ncbi:unnamed protein product [marine sediment metagenome]|uniref:histidine kinase n=1 Tax=marine sediment metagenome TaxID=412755 RepID=X0YPQ4_9ZZZZ
MQIGSALEVILLSLALADRINIIRKEKEEAQVLAIDNLHKADKLTGIFESFKQADASTSRVYGGTGLGLSITRQLIELHGGTIRAESTVDKGSQFIFTLPGTNELLYP